MFNSDRNSFLVRIASINRAQQKVVPTSLRAHLLHHSHFPPLASHPGEKCMYNRMQRNNTVHGCPMTCTRQWDIDARSSEISRLKNVNDPYKYSQQVAHWNLSLWGHLVTTFKDDKQQAVWAGNDRWLLKTSQCNRNVWEDCFAFSINVYKSLHNPVRYHPVIYEQWPVEGNETQFIRKLFFCMC